jgi:mycobactin lysine-N-oxygenase
MKQTYLPTLVVVGAGPRALALHVRARCCAELGLPSLKVVLLESHSVGAHWSGHSGFTDGLRALVTLPEHDLGFPYRSNNLPLDRAISRYSWHSFLVANRLLANWVDSGRAAPSHGLFAKYLNWAAGDSAARVCHAVVEEGGISKVGNAWRVSYRDPATRQRKRIHAQGLVITGPGTPRKLIGMQPDHPTITDGNSFWLPPCISQFRRFEEGLVAVIGSGDTAASVICALLDILPRHSEVGIHHYTKGAVTKTEGIAARQRISDPAGWSDLPPEERNRILGHTQRGVTSRDLQDRIERDPNVSRLSGMVRDAVVEGNRVRLIIRDRDGQTHTSPPYRRTIVATGFRRWTFERLFADISQFPWVEQRGDDWENEKERQLADRMDTDLSFKPAGVPKLYVPALAGAQCGPGFENLGCLGLMSQRILDSVLEYSRR